MAFLTCNSRYFYWTFRYDFIRCVVVSQSICITLTEEWSFINLSNNYMNQRFSQQKYYSTYIYACIYIYKISCPNGFQICYKTLPMLTILTFESFQPVALCSRTLHFGLKAVIFDEFLHQNPDS